MKRIHCFFGLMVVLAQGAHGQAKNVILFLGDAAGIPTLNAASIYRYDDPQKLFIQHMPNMALVDTSTASEWVTDSAAGMTAIVTGRKTNNGVISQGPNAQKGKKDGDILKTILEYAEERGLSTGVLSNMNITDATTAACYAHSNDRNASGAIFAQVFTPRFGDGVDVVIGSGRDEVMAAVAKIGVDVAESAKRKGYAFYDSIGLVSDADKRIIVLSNTMEFDVWQATSRAIRILSRNPKGYFLMVEWDAHTDDLKRGLEHAIQLDDTIRNTAQMVKNDTLILFSADHSFDIRLRGGKRGEPVLPQGAPAGSGAAIPKPAIRVDDGHTGEQVLSAAQGPGADRLRGFIGNTDLFHIMMAAFGWEAWKGPKPITQ